MKTLAEKDIIENVRIEAVASLGQCIAKHDGQILFVSHAAIGDVADIEITDARSQFAKGRIKQLHQASADRITSFCEHYGRCGGCQWQHLEYTAQQAYKLAHLNDTLPKISGLALPNITQLHAAESQQQFRNKVTFSFSHDCWQANKSNDKTKGLGLHAYQQPETIVDIHHCYLIPDEANAIAQTAKQLALASELSFFRHTKQQGLLIDLVLRVNQAGKYMVMLHIGYEHEGAAQLLTLLCEQHASIESGYLLINHEKSAQLNDASLQHVHGNAFLVDTLGALNFEISPKAFYQTNAVQAQVLYDRVRALADINETSVVYDMYCGTGTIGLWLADSVQHIIGIETVEDAVADAERNAKLNNIDNARFFKGNAETLISKQFLKRNGKPDVVVVDPPRAGLDQNLCQQLGELKPKQIIYVSCDPATQARDFKRLSEHYVVTTIEAVDMFPHSYHCETVAVLQAKKDKLKTHKRRLKF